MSCLLNFGEVDIPSSRAFWDDGDEDGAIPQDVEKLKLTFEPNQSEEPITADLMFVIEGAHILEFVEQTLLRDTTKVCKIPSAKNSALYHAKDRNFLLAIIEKDLTHSGEVTELLLPYARLAKNVITLIVRPKVEYKSENIAKVRDEITFLRGINSKVEYVKELEVPNFIAGVAAGVASWRHHEKLSTSAYVAYTDKVALDTLAAQPILKLLKDLGIDCATTFTAKLRDDSHLYT